MSMLASIMRFSLRLLAKPFLGPPFSVSFQRRWAAMLTSIKVVARGTGFELINMNRVPARLIATADAAERCILYLHGGAYVLGSPQSHRGLCSHLAKAANARLYAIDYRLAPEHVYPAALEDAMAAYRWLLEHGHDAGNIVVAGDSAGGGLAVATVNAIRDAGLPAPSRVALISPFVDLTLAGESMKAMARADPMLREDWLMDSGNFYRANTPADNPGCSPLFADISGFPPTLIHVGSEEILLDDSHRLRDKLLEAGVPVELRMFKGMWHDFQLQAGLVPAAGESLREMAEFLFRRD